MTNAEKFFEVFGLKADPECCPLACADNDGGFKCFECPRRKFFKDEYQEGAK